jgi:hypothetical protein
MSHVVLLGDSIFDNSAYTLDEPDVVTHLRTFLPQEWRATLLAVDGATIGGMGSQVARVMDDTTHLVVSIGGNDVLEHTALLRARVASTSEALALFSSRVAQFATDYRSAIERVLALRRETILCTIYNGNLDREVAGIARMALTLFNDVILQLAIELGLAAIELRQVCSTPTDYANAIEPSGAGGRKIAAAIAASLGVVPARRRATVVGAA